LVEREKKIKTRLEVLQKTTKLHRESRKKQGVPVIALLGYTNAGTRGSSGKIGWQPDHELQVSLLF